MENVLRHLKKHITLSNYANELVLSCIDSVSIKKNSEIITIGRPNKYMYIVKTGVVRGYYYKDFQEITVSLWMENETFGDVTTYITNNPAIKSYQAIEDTELYRMDIHRFRSFFEVNHEICNLARIISERYILKSQYLSNCLIHLTAEEKYQLFLINKPGLINRVKIKHIASYLDITPETLSRIRCSEIYNQRSMVS